MKIPNTYLEFKKIYEASNGKLPDGLLVKVDGEYALNNDAASAFNKMRAAAKEDGIILNVNSAYRSYAKQVKIAKEKGLYSKGGLAAEPGTSNHGWGAAIDIQVGRPNSKIHKWLKKNASTYGFVGNVKREPWHWEHTASISKIKKLKDSKDESTVDATPTPVSTDTAQKSNNTLNGLVLRPGMFGLEVKQIQQKLRNSKHLSNQYNSGYYDLATYNAVKKFQSENNLNVDGIVGNETSSALG